jgi:hypothetical protein
MAVGRPLLPQPALARRLQDFFNLQSSRRRLISIGGVSSHLHAPSGFVPGGVEVGSDEFDGGGLGAGLDRVFLRWSKGLVAKSLGRVVIFLFFMTLSVIVTPPLIMKL